MTSVVIAPAVKPAGSRMISAGIRRRLASTWEPTASDEDQADPDQHLVGRHGSCQFSAYQAATRSVTFRPPHSRASIRDGHRDTRSTGGMS